ncbi:GntR family transcriptional regulator [Aeromicrobium sp. P5_D10]
MTTNVSLTREAHAQLRSDILEGRIRPNERLVAGTLAERLNISRTPVREALQLLAADGLIVAVNRGYVVREHTGDEIRQIYEVRAALEEMAARLVAERATDEQIASIEAIGAHEESIAEGSRAVIVQLNGVFHEAIVQICGNDLLATLNKQNSEQFFNRRVARLYSDQEATDAICGHREILDALKSRDADAAAAAARRHVMQALQVTMDKIG